MPKQNQPNPLLIFIRPLLTIAVTALLLLGLRANTNVNAAAGIYETINFQGRLLNSTGAVVPDGTYNIEFKIYCGGDGALGTVTNGDCTHATEEDLLWTETRESGNKVVVKNGYFSVYLGSVTAFASLIDWNQDELYLSINIGGTGTPSYDGQMDPFTRLSASPYALNSKALGGLQAANFVQLAQGVQTDSSTSNPSVYINKTGNTANILQLQRGGVDVLTVSNGGALAVKTTSDSATGFTVSDSDGGTAVLTVDTADERVAVSGTPANGLLTIGTDTTAASGGLYFGTDTNLYRSAANTLKTDDNFETTGNVTVGGILQAAAGSAGSPSITFSGDPNTGFYSSGTDAMTFMSGGTDKISFGANNTSQILEFWPTNQTLNVSGNNSAIVTNSTLTMTGTGALISGWSFSPTIVWEENPFIFGGAFLFASQATHKNAAGEARTFTPFYSFLAQTTLQADGAAVTSGVQADFVAADTFGVINSGTLAVTDYYQYWAQAPTISAGATISNRYGMLIATPTVSGTLTNNYGIKIANQSTGTDSYGIVIGDAITNAVWINDTNNSTDEAGGIVFGSSRDTNLYRGAANQLKTNDDLLVKSTANSTTALQVIPSDTTTAVLGVDTSNRRVGVNTNSPQSAFQVGDASNPSNMDIYGDITHKGVSKQTGLTNITDVYVYDTTRDSDGGAWTNSSVSQGLSWYGESKDDGVGDACDISNDDRCGTSTFPRKVILVTTTSGLYIFDAANYTLFMKFTQSGTFALGADSNNNPSSVFALNGVIYVGTNGGSATGLYALDFSSDRLFNYNTTDRDQGDKNIANRNTTVTYATNSKTAFAIADNVINDVHGTQVSGSFSQTTTSFIPLHGVTYIAVATDTGASLIDLSGSKVIDYGDNLTDDVNQVWVTKRAVLYLTNETLAQVEEYTALDADVTNQNAPDDIFDETINNVPNLAKTTPTMSTSPDALQVIEQNSLAVEFGTNTTSASGDVIYVGHSLGLTEIHDTSGTPTSTNFGWSKFYKTTGSTGLMSGNERAMFGFDEASGDATDYTFNNNVLEAKGTPTRQVNGVHAFGTRLNGSSQYYCSDANNDATCDTDAEFDPAAISFSIELWFKHPTSISGTDTLIDHTYNTSNTLGAGYRITMNSSGNIVAGIDDDGTAFDDDLLTSLNTFNDDQWHHLVFVRVSTALTNPTAAVGAYLYIDGRAQATDTSIAATATLNSSAILGIGADCSVGAACATGANFWDGDIDDVYFSMGGSTSANSMNPPAGAYRRKFLEGRSALTAPSTIITNATTFSSTTIGDSGASYTPNEFVGTVVEITGGTGAGQTRRVVANDATTFTVNPAWSVTPDSTSDYEIVPEQLYGDTDSVSSIAITDNDFLGRSRTMFVGTSNGGGGGISVFRGYGTPAVTDVYHTDAGVSDSDSNAWSGTNADNMTSLDVRGGVVAFGSQANMWFQKDDQNLDRNLDQIFNNLASIRQELTLDGLVGATSEFMMPGIGADLAEYYTSFDSLIAGDVVAQEENVPGGVRHTSTPYDQKLLGIVATQPGLILGPKEENSHPVALTGRVPVNVVLTPGQTIKSGDRITSSEVPGYGMKAVQAGRAIGASLEDVTESMFKDCPTSIDASYKCASVMVFVNLVDFMGQPVEVAIEDFESSGLSLPDPILEPVRELISLQDDTGLNEQLSDSDRILRYLIGRRQQTGELPQSEILADRISSFEINTAKLFAKDIYANSLTVDKVKANQIEGLELLVNRLTSQPVATDSAESTEQASLLVIDQITAQNISVELDLSVSGSLFANGALQVAGPAEFQGTTIFHRLATFIDRVVFNQDVAFKGRTTFNSDTAGFATIHKTQKEVKVEFEKEYEQLPVVTVVVKNGVFTHYAYKDLSQKGFTITLPAEATEEVEFAWTALSIENARTTDVPLPPLNTNSLSTSP